MSTTLKAILFSGMIMISALAGYARDKNPMTRLSDGTYVIDTTDLASDIKGYNGATPIKVYIKKDKVVKVEALPNKETPSYFKRLTYGFTDKWNGKKVKKAAKLDVDCHTGATYSAKAVKENVKIAIDYYLNNK